MSHSGGLVVVCYAQLSKSTNINEHQNIHRTQSGVDSGLNRFIYIAKILVRVLP